ncbi:hypothetical protein FOXB_16291 [Fusarium oxysporum f. sp. conglutinans Fo5176]|uniref:PiggyBac transposable element-derived protein domain-containing protein n=1 Tax=Fusarium oxysporum (strain Fo5176) TaxID=660025 RepID=F9GCA8_FUSOF|nr:hypothetical protein FOXB_16291 [Fusarium oxysporum f. sp. conglutinans Fo5176]
MNTPPILEEIQVINAYDDKSFIKEEHSHRLWPDDPTRALVLPAENDRVTNFEPFHVKTRNFHINTLPPTPLQLFHLFLPISLVEEWVSYTKIWISWLKRNEVIDSWTSPMGKTSRLRHWEGTTTSEVLRPEHSIFKFMPYWKFQLIHRHLRPFDPSKIDETAPLPEVFQAAEKWSDLLQAVSLSLFLPGSHLAVDEGMVRYTGKSNETTVIKGKPTPLGFKI